MGRVPVIDLFAGPGGLGEGFSRSRTARFQVAVSIEKDEMAFETLRLRAAHRALTRSGAATAAVWRRWDAIIAEAPWNIVFDTLQACDVAAISGACEEARREAWHFELGPSNRHEAHAGIRTRLEHLGIGHELPRNAVLIGGPPCQAYSIVGRSRNRGTKGYKAEEDPRHFLYREYLHVISDFQPAIFVMENVKGILSSQVHDRQIFQSILRDLRRPDVASGKDAGLEYDLFAMGESSESLFDLEPGQFLLEAEAHGVPQARHRVIILGVRRDVSRAADSIGHLRPMAAPTVREVLGDLPRLRPKLSFRGAGKQWADSFSDPLMVKALTSLKASGDPTLERVGRRMDAARKSLERQQDPGTGADRVVLKQGEMARPAALASWYRDRPTAVLANHEARAHMPSDLVRYLFVSSFGDVTGSSPRLHDFPTCLLPAHKNVNPIRPEAAIFKDRFRVQVADHHSMTVTSHIAKDGHAFVHFDPTQCRSLTVREAARLQTFPDSYVFLGNRTAQYTQVGNAVPPFLAYQIADVVGKILMSAGLAEEGVSNSQRGAELPRRPRSVRDDELAA